MPVVVTGAAGHVGANLVRALRERGHAVRALVHRERRSLRGLDVELVSGDIRDRGSLVRAFAGADVVYHAAAYISLTMGDWPRSYEINVLGTRNVVEACLDCGVRRLIYFSSIHALDIELTAGTVDESCPLVDGPPHPPYDRSKAAAEIEVRQGAMRGLETVILNPTGIIGPLDYGPSHFGTALLLLARGRLPGLIAGGFDWVDVRDVAWAALQAAERAPAGAKYLISGHWVDVSDLAQAVSGFTGVRAPRFVSPLFLARLGAPFATLYSRLTRTTPIYTSVSLRALCRRFTVSCARAAADLGYRPRPFAETIVDTLAWFREEGMW